MTENLNDVIQAMDDAKPSRKRSSTAPAKKPAQDAIEDIPEAQNTESTNETDNDVQSTPLTEGDSHTGYKEAADCDAPSFPGCNTCRNFGSYPAWQPCCDCMHNPKNANSYYHA
jgi:hypothetical protein